jgi:hypothetical protein
MKNFLKIVSVYVGAFLLAQRACVPYIWLLFKYAFICIPNTGRHIRIIFNNYFSKYKHRLNI